MFATNKYEIKHFMLLALFIVRSWRVDDYELAIIDFKFMMTIIRIIEIWTMCSNSPIDWELVGI